METPFIQSPNYERNVARGELDAAYVTASNVANAAYAAAAADATADATVAYAAAAYAAYAYATAAKKANQLKTANVCREILTDFVKSKL
jgi:hypothetical protein